MDNNGDLFCVFNQKPLIAYITGIVLIIGVLISYLPQHIAIIRRKSSKGISWLSILLANVSTSCNVVNAVLEQWETVKCCKEFTALECNQNLLSIYQIAMGWINSFILYILVLLYFPKFDDEISLDEEDEPLLRRIEHKLFGSFPNRKRAQIAWWMYIIFCLVLFPIAGFVLLYSYGPKSEAVKDYAFSIGMVSTAAIVIQWTPQIIKTYMAKEIGSLSIAMLALQAPGSFLVVFFQGVEYHADVSTWMPFFLTGIQQVVLLILCIYFELKRYIVNKRLKAKMNNFSINADAVERAPLLLVPDEYSVN